MQGAFQCWLEKFKAAGLGEAPWLLAPRGDCHPCRSGFSWSHCLSTHSCKGRGPPWLIGNSTPTWQGYWLSEWVGERGKRKWGASPRSNTGDNASLPQGGLTPPIHFEPHWDTATHLPCSPNFLSTVIRRPHCFPVGAFLKGCLMEVTLPTGVIPQEDPAHRPGGPLLFLPQQARALQVRRKRLMGHPSRQGQPGRCGNI